MAIYFQKETKTFYLESKDVSYVFGVSEYGVLVHYYFGKRIAREDLSHVIELYGRGQENCLPNTPHRVHCLNTYPQEFPMWGRTDYRESMVSVNDNGVRFGMYEYVSHKIYNVKPKLEGMPSVRDGKTLAVTLKDTRNGMVAILYYTVCEDAPVIVRRLELVNHTGHAVTIDRAYSFAMDIPNQNYETVSLYGGHVRERFIDRNPLVHGVFTVDSKRASSSGQLNPFLALVRPETGEENGEAIAVNLVYSGSYAIKAQLDSNENVRFVGGINDADFEWNLPAGKKFSTPEAVLVYSDAGLGKMSRALHDFYRKHLINPRFVDQPRPIVINNWEATYFNFDTKKLCDIIDSVKGTGIDTLVLDDGWFGVRNNDLSGLGDWFVNTDKLPAGLTPIIEHAHDSGMKFGLWFEPEMVNKDSDLYRAHPDWAISVPGVEPCPGRDQQILDLTRDEVCEYVIKVVTDILKNNDIDYVKWDMNRTMTEFYSIGLGKKSKEIAHRYILGVYRICEAIIEGFPHIFFEGCASGGCRFDPGMLYYFPQIWTSDDTDAYMRTIIQYGTTICYPLSSMSCHVADVPNHQTGRKTPLASRADIAHLGATGYELDTTKFSPETIEEVKAQVAAYKEMEELVLHGDLYRLSSAQNTNLFAFELVAKDKSKAHVTAMRPLNMPNFPSPRLYLKGLDEKAVYEIPELSLTLSGSTIANAGLVVRFDGVDFATKTLTLIRK